MRDASVFPDYVWGELLGITKEATVPRSELQKHALVSLTEAKLWPDEGRLPRELFFEKLATVCHIGGGLFAVQRETAASYGAGTCSLGAFVCKPLDVAGFFHTHPVGSATLSAPDVGCWVDNERIRWVKTLLVGARGPDDEVLVRSFTKRPSTNLRLLEKELTLFQSRWLTEGTRYIPVVRSREDELTAGDVAFFRMVRSEKEYDDEATSILKQYLSVEERQL